MQPATKIIEPDKRPLIADEAKESVILPVERELMAHFCIHYQTFLKELDNGVEEAFLMTPSDKVALYAIYCDNWGQRKH